MNAWNTFFFTTENLNEMTDLRGPTSSDNEDGGDNEYLNLQ